MDVSQCHITKVLNKQVVGEFNCLTRDCIRMRCNRCDRIRICSISVKVERKFFTYGNADIEPVKHQVSCRICRHIPRSRVSANTAYHDLTKEAGVRRIGRNRIECSVFCGVNTSFVVARVHCHSELVRNVPRFEMIRAIDNHFNAIVVVRQSVKFDRSREVNQGILIGIINTKAIDTLIARAIPCIGVVVACAVVRVGDDEYASSYIVFRNIYHHRVVGINIFLTLNHIYVGRHDLEFQEVVIERRTLDPAIVIGQASSMNNHCVTPRICDSDIGSIVNTVVVEIIPYIDNAIVFAKRQNGRIGTIDLYACAVIGAKSKGVYRHDCNIALNSSRIDTSRPQIIDVSIFHMLCMHVALTIGIPTTDRISSCKRIEVEVCIIRLRYCGVTIHIVRIVIINIRIQVRIGYEEYTSICLSYSKSEVHHIINRTRGVLIGSANAIGKTIPIGYIKVSSSIHTHNEDKSIDRVGVIPENNTPLIVTRFSAPWHLSNDNHGIRIVVRKSVGAKASIKIEIRVRSYHMTFIYTISIEP